MSTWGPGKKPTHAGIYVSTEKVQKDRSVMPVGEMPLSTEMAWLGLASHGGPT